jgi:hypothetical protein
MIFTYVQFVFLFLDHILEAIVLYILITGVFEGERNNKYLIRIKTSIPEGVLLLFPS